MQMEEKDKAGEPIEDPPHNIRIISKDGKRTAGGGEAGGEADGSGMFMVSFCVVFPVRGPRGCLG